MRKFFFILFAMICSSSLFAQIAQTFVPETGKTYYIKPATNATAAYLQFLTDNSGTLKFEKMEVTAAKAAANAQWEVQYVTDNGYILKNKGTGAYVTNAVNATSASDGDKCYYELRVAGDFFLGNSIQTKSYGIIIAGDAGSNGFDISINETGSTINKWGYGTGDNNRRFVIISEDDVDAFDRPVESGTYYIKSIRNGNTQAGYVAEDATAKLTVIPATDAAGNLNAEWEIAYVDGSGYSLKNKGTGNYFTTTSTTNNTRDAIDLSSSTASSFYSLSYSPKSYKSGKYSNGAYSGNIYGGCYITPAGASVSLDAFGDTYFGVWSTDKTDGGSDNGSFIFQTPEQAKLYVYQENAFTPVSDTKYYIKSTWFETVWGKSQDDMVDVYVADNGGVKLETIDPDGIKTSGNAQWYITYNETDGGYYFQNVGTGNYVKVNNDADKTLSMAAKDDVDSFLFRIAINDNTDPVYTYTNTTTENTFTTVGYLLVNKFYNRGFDLIRDKFTIGTWAPNDEINKRWMILTETELTNLINVKTGVSTGIDKNTVNNSQVSVYSDGNVIYVNTSEVARTAVYNLQGQLLYSGTNSVIEGIPSGACIVKLTTKEGVYNRKLIVK